MLILVPVPLSPRRILEWVFWRDLRTRLQRLRTSPLEPSPLGAGVFRKVLRLSFEGSVACDLLDITSASWWRATVETRWSFSLDRNLKACETMAMSISSSIEGTPRPRLGGSRGNYWWYVLEGEVLS